MDRADVQVILDALHRFPGIHAVTFRECDPATHAGGCAWTVSFRLDDDYLGRSAVWLIRMAAQDLKRIQFREDETRNGRIHCTFRGLAESRPDDLAAAVDKVGRRLFEQLHDY